MAILILAMMFPTAVFASGPVTVTLTTDAVGSVKANDTFTVTASIPAGITDKVSNLGIGINYDRTAFEITKIQSPDAFEGSKKTATSVSEAQSSDFVYAGYTSNEDEADVDVSAGATLVITCKVKEGASAGSKDFTLYKTTVSSLDAATGLPVTTGFITIPAGLKATVEVISTISGTQDITMNTRPASGATTSTVAASGTNFTVSFSEWKQGGTDVTSFVSNTEYTAKGTLTANDGYIFASDATVKLSDASAGSVSGGTVSTNGKTLTFTYSYTTPALPPYGDTAATISSVAKSGGNIKVTATVPTGETAQYGYSASNDAAAVTNWQDSDTFSMPAAGTYYFFARVKASSTHLAGGESSGTPYTVNGPLSLSYTAPTSMTVDTAISNMSPTVSGGTGTYSNYVVTAGTLPSGLSIDASTGKITGTPDVAGAETTVTVTVTDSEGATGTFDIAFPAVAKQANTLTVTQGDVEYGTAVNPSATSNGNPPIIMYKVQGAEDGTYASEAPKDVGAYTVKATSTGDATVADATVTADFQIKPKELTNVSVSGITVSKEYDGTTDAGTLSGTVTFDGKVGSDDISIKAAAGTYADKNVGTGKTVTLTLSLDGTAKGNYTLSTTSVNITNAEIAAKDITKTGATATATLLKSGADFDDPVINVNGKTVEGTYSYTYGTETDKAKIVNTLKGKAAGDYNVDFTFTPAGPNYTGMVSGKVTVTVQDKTNAGVTINDVPTSKTYGESFTLTASVTDAGTGTNAWTWSSSDSNVLQVNGTGASATVKALKAGSATISAKYESNTTMDTKTTASITINKATVTVAAKNQSIYVGGTVPSLTPPVKDTHYTVTGLVGSDTLAGTLAMKYQKAGVDATPTADTTGTYDIVISGVSEPDTTNYNTIVLTNGTLTISNPSSSGGGSSAATPPVSDKAAKELKNAKEGSTVAIDMKGETKLPASVTKEIAGKDVTVELDMGGGMVWSFNGLDVPKGGVKLDLGVKTGTKTIPATVINDLSRETTTLQLQLNHNGSFGMSLNLSVDLGKKHDGMYANLYFYNPKSGELEFRSAGMISGGKASWAFDHASDYAIVIDKESHEPMTFTDVPDTAYYAEAVNWAVAKKITEGVGNNLFAPNDPCTRAQIVTFLWRAAGSPAPKNMSSFTDVPADAFYAKAVAWAVENGITGGTGDGKFSPDATCTRAQSVTFLYRASGAPAVSGNAEFGDVATNAYYAAAVKWAEKNGITGGIGGGLFGSDNDCTRAQIVTFLYRSVK